MVIAAIFGVALVVGGIVHAIGKYSSSIKGSNRRKRRKRRQALLLMEKSREQAKLTGRKAESIRSTQVAAFAAAGIKGSSGSGSEIQGETMFEAILQQELTIQSALTQGREELRAASQIAAEERKQASMQLVSDITGAVSSGVTTGFGGGLGGSAPKSAAPGSTSGGGVTATSGTPITGGSQALTTIQ